MSQGLVQWTLGSTGQRSRSQCIDIWKWFMLHNPFLSSWKFTHRLPMSWGYSLSISGLKGQGHNAWITENGNLHIIAFSLHIQSWNFAHRFPMNQRYAYILVIFSSPEPKAQVSYCHSAPSVVRPSVHPLSVVRKLSHFQLLLWNGWRNSTKLDRMQDLNVLYQVCVFRADPKNKMAAPASDWLRHFQLLLWNQWTDFNETWQEARSQCLLPSLCFSGRSLKKKMAAMAHDWLRHFWLLLWNCWTGFKEIWQEARSQHLLPSCVFQSDE